MINVMTISRNVQDKYAAMFGLRNARIYSMKKKGPRWRASRGKKQRTS